MHHPQKEKKNKQTEFGVMNVISCDWCASFFRVDVFAAVIHPKLTRFNIIFVV